MLSSEVFGAGICIGEPGYKVLVTFLMGCTGKEQQSLV
ncbi:hypothetical protein APHCRT_0564 [Anaplasma phagocytophilum str. CRT53-1]|uniref:Uncharacterized protein n=3 Tax=Anaplasma phagocytophilum TaxID=948 RepID=Q2GKN3_ANAPZ|nr:hypothetical protein APH_0467 [Anaplasma phagocytophilum str. HZ]AGR81840.1 hypothetical protein YYY_02315 [Anaplasma phagocytophilum str. Dog2]KJV59674.1 hypothetical protein APHWEB_0011 [Anaplasma phagocytophilum str. Webster]KJV66212.1 hypothetical protein EPHNCH_0733 [Anaplasma phagocytophilum str. NCH-1]KJV83617.1 hypothetical protein APHHGE2_0727 [Anaplasma phagocytophilum str. HGE2]KJV86110.1 hypothetical protein APHCRT_0564 [Anaplasma phagocytophilum str. CRT53-1]KJV87737.1 hypothe